MTSEMNFFLSVVVCRKLGSKTTEFFQWGGGGGGEGGGREREREC